MKTMERFEEQVETRKRVEDHNLKFIHGNWNSKFGNNTYLHFKVNFERLSKINFEQVMHLLKLQNSRVQCFK